MKLIKQRAMLLFWRCRSQPPHRPTQFSISLSLPPQHKARRGNFLISFAQRIPTETMNSIAMASITLDITSFAESERVVHESVFIYTRFFHSEKPSIFQLKNFFIYFDLVNVARLRHCVKIVSVRCREANCNATDKPTLKRLTFYRSRNIYFEITIFFTWAAVELGKKKTSTAQWMEIRDPLINNARHTTFYQLIIYNSIVERVFVLSQCSSVERGQHSALFWCRNLENLVALQNPSWCAVDAGFHSITPQKLCLFLFAYASTQILMLTTFNSLYHRGA